MSERRFLKKPIEKPINFTSWLYSDALQPNPWVANSMTHLAALRKQEIFKEKEILLIVLP